MVPEVHDFPEETEVLKVVARETTQREYIQIRTAREEDDEQNAERISRHHVAREYHSRTERIEFAPVMYRLPEAKRYTDQVAQEERRDTEEERNREAAHDDVPDRKTVGVARAQVQVQHVPEPREVTLPGGLVKTEVRLDLRYLVGRQSLRGIHPALHGRGLLRTRNHFLHGAARQHLDENKTHQRNPDERRDHEQQAAEDIGSHSLPSASSQFLVTSY